MSCSSCVGRKLKNIEYIFICAILLSNDEEIIYKTWYVRTGFTPYWSDISFNDMVVWMVVRDWFHPSSSSSITHFAKVTRNITSGVNHITLMIFCCIDLYRTGQLVALFGSRLVARQSGSYYNSGRRKLSRCCWSINFFFPIEIALLSSTCEQNVCYTFDTTTTMLLLLLSSNFFTSYFIHLYMLLFICKIRWNCVPVST